MLSLAGLNRSETAFLSTVTEVLNHPPKNYAIPNCNTPQEVRIGSTIVQKGVGEQLGIQEAQGAALTTSTGKQEVGVPLLFNVGLLVNRIGTKITAY